MKKITMILLAVSILFQVVYAQKADFRMASGVIKEGDIVGGLFNIQKESFWALVGSPAQKKGMLQLYSYSLKQLNHDLDVLNTRDLPDFLPSSFTTFKFGDYIAFNGANDVNLMNSSRKENVIVFTDKDFNKVKEINRKVKNENFRFTDDFSLVLSNDSTKLLTLVFVNENPGKPGTPKLKAIIEVYDSKLDMVWQKSFIISQYLGDDPRPIRCMMLKDNRIVMVTADKQGSKTKLHVCTFGDQESDPVVSTRILNYPTASFKFYLKDAETMIIGGLVSNADVAKEMFYMEYNLNKNDFVLENSTELGKNFGAAYPGISKALAKAYPISSYYSTDYFLPFGEGSLLVFDGSYNYDGNYNPRPIAFIAFNSEGQVKWVKLIPRYLITDMVDFTTYSAFIKGDVLQIFYGTDPETEGKMEVPFAAKYSETGIGMYYSELDVNGDMTPGKLLTKANLNAFSYSISRIIRLEDDFFITQCKRFKSRNDNKPAINLGTIRLSGE